MFAVIYRGFVKPGLEKDYQKHWKMLASYLTAERGALEAKLHKAEEGMWVAYSKWPDKKTRDASWPNPSALPHKVQSALDGLKACLIPEKQLPEICMELIEEI